MIYKLSYDIFLYPTSSNYLMQSEFFLRIAFAKFLGDDSFEV
jgi:hypothetical protein